jgi:hypothetical protein
MGNLDAANAAKKRLRAAREAAIASTGVTPLAFLLGVMRTRRNPLDVRLEAAKAAAPYVHPKLAQIAHTGPNGGPMEAIGKITVELVSARSDS